ncbi:predicted protein [Plenodomus lingam JN3]|uniref:Predicted protein n=1 Tax=Leptosphaeria maculans (strain JN3 / isolate v23.1.3 / race Av1-4-5-6-7-8) TaxID=985895 RepID=E4ZWG1_LEPMJ|nr:predicted protein [Plenodomus lingam JN3]CBX95937.1 predicted protein [Plenodomus lingam JN3]
MPCTRTDKQARHRVPREKQGGGPMWLGRELMCRGACVWWVGSGVCSIHTLEVHCVGGKWGQG